MDNRVKFLGRGRSGKLDNPWQSRNDFGTGRE